MALLKRVLRNETVRRFLCWVGSGYIRLVHASGRWTVVGGHIPVALWDRGEPFILCFWHGRLLMMPYCWRPKKAIHMMVSHHADGQFVARTMSHLGIRTVAGSTTRGGAAALRQLIKLLKAGDCVGLTPDGPRGPRMRASEGAAALARLSGAAIVPATYAIDRRRVLSSWDRFVVALPFGRGVIVWGEPIRIARNADARALEDGRTQLEESLNRITAEADRLCGHAPIAPAAESVRALEAAP